jgi:hypothetical protein
VYSVAAKTAPEITDGCGGKINVPESCKIDILVAFGSYHVTPLAGDVAMFVIQQLKEPFSFLDNHIFGNLDLRSFIG